MDTIGGEAISEELFSRVESLLPEGAVILELGSGYGTRRLCEKWKVYSVENSRKWISKAPSRYIYAPLKDGWYDPRFLRLPEYDLLLVDGPRSPKGAPTRHNMLKHLDLFNLSVPIIIDDVHRPAEKRLLAGLALATGRMPEIIDCGDKSFASL